jgi:hypothetical protein
MEGSWPGEKRYTPEGEEQAASYVATALFSVGLVAARGELPHRTGFESASRLLELKRGERGTG